MLEPNTCYDYYMNLKILSYVLLVGTFVYAYIAKSGWSTCRALGDPCSERILIESLVVIILGIVTLVLSSISTKGRVKSVMDYVAIFLTIFVMLWGGFPAIMFALLGLFFGVLPLLFSSL
jgi:hypothetical protein